MYEARRLAELGWLPVAGEVMREATALTEVVEHEWRPPVETEVPVESRDGMFRGRVDRAEHDAGGGTKLVDVKSALRPDLPERYERQLQLYALMWRDTRGEWPAEAVVVYPFTGVEYAVTIDAQTCERVAAEAVSVVRVLAEQRNAERLGTPGDVCKVCEYRPWCRPFWRWQAGERNRMVALEGAVMGFEGTLESVEKIGEQWRLTMRWREGAMVRVVAPADRFAQLEQATPGMRVRVLDTRLQGMPNRPQGVAGGPSEIWLVA
jgi:CRISPR/Cas system-associated exonuclease Cas4 (RecB family)